MVDRRRHPRDGGRQDPPDRLVVDPWTVGPQISATKPTLGTLFTIVIATQTTAQFPAEWFGDRYGPTLPTLAGDIADLIESGDHEIQLSDDQDREELRDYIRYVENSDEPIDPGTNAAVRIARSLLSDQDDD